MLLISASLTLYVLNLFNQHIITELPTMFHAYIPDRCIMLSLFHIWVCTVRQHWTSDQQWNGSCYNTSDGLMCASYKRNTGSWKYLNQNIIVTTCTRICLKINSLLVRTHKSRLNIIRFKLCIPWCDSNPQSQSL